MVNGGHTMQAAWGEHRPGPVAAMLISAARSRLSRGPIKKGLYHLFLRIHKGPVDVMLEGRPVRLYPARNLSEQRALFRPERLDVAERRAIRHFIKNEGSVFIDVGANAGIYTLDAAIHAGDRSRIIAIEPRAELLSRLRFNEQQARRTGHIAPGTTIETHAVAISHYDGEGRLALTEKEGENHLAESGVPVTIRSLLSLVRELGVEKIDALKIDIEGHEDRVLCPFLDEAPETLWPQLIIIEHVHRNEWSRDCIAECISRGYRAHTFRCNTLLKKPPNQLAEVGALAN